MSDHLPLSGPARAVLAVLLARPLEGHHAAGLAAECGLGEVEVAYAIATLFQLGWAVPVPREAGGPARFGFPERGVDRAEALRSVTRGRLGPVTCAVLERLLADPVWPRYAGELGRQCHYSTGAVRQALVWLVGIGWVVRREHLGRLPGTPKRGRLPKLVTLVPGWAGLARAAVEDARAVDG